MINRHKLKDITWVDLENPSPEEVRSLVEEFSIDPEVANELLTPTVRPRVEFNTDYLYLILHFPTAHSHKEDAHDLKKTEEVDFIIGKKFLITTRYESIDALHEFSRVFEVKSIIDKSNIVENAGYIFFYMIQHLYKVTFNKLENVKDLLNEIEEQIFEQKERQMVIELSKVNRVLLTFNEAIRAHREVLLSFEIASEQFFGQEYKYYTRSIIGEYYKVEHYIENNRDYLDELRNTNDSLLSTKQNEIMKVLTIMAFITFPLTLVAGLFGMNTKEIPIVGIEHDFWIVIGIMFGLTALMFGFFRFKKWL